MFSRLLGSEWIKVRKSSMWLLVFVSPLFASIVGFFSMRFDDTERQFWEFLLSDMGFAHGLLFMPLLAGLFAAFVCRYEHDSGGWKQLLALPVHRSKVYLAKFTLVAMLLAATQLLYLAGMLAAGIGAGLEGPIPVGLMLQCAIGGLLATLPLAALQLAVSVGWANFAAPLAINVMLTLPNILVVNSQDFGPYYPWAQPFLAMLPDTAESFGAMNTPFVTLMLVIAAGFVVFFTSGLTYFRRRDY